MSSKKNVELDVDFERDVPTTPEDIEALWRARRSMRPLSTAAYLEWITVMSEGYVREPWRDNTDDDEPFEL